MATVNGQDVTLTQDQLCYVEEAAILSVELACDAACDWYMLEFDCSEFLFFSVENGYRRMDVSGAVGEEFFAIDRLIRSGSEYAGDADARLLLILQEARRSGHATQEGNRLLMERIQRYISEHSHEALTVEQVAQALGYHKNHLGRTVRQCANTTLRDMIIEERLHAAKELLRATDTPIGRIASLLSFGNVNDFHKFFTYHTGMTPVMYRKGRD